jgi:predicted enzyme related to lactoylglutathione lyase
MNDVIFIIYVADQGKSRIFYEQVLEKPPVLDVPGMTEFQINENSKLGIMPEEGIARLLGDHCTPPPWPKDFPRCEIYLMAEDVEASFKKLIDAGGKTMSPPSLRNWGDIVAYGADPDGHIIAFAQKA